MPTLANFSTKLPSSLNDSGKEDIREGLLPLEFRKREPAALCPVHGPTHSQIAVHAPHCMSWFPGVKPDGIEPVSRDVLLRFADPDPVPMPAGFVFSPGLQHFLHPVWWYTAAGNRAAARDWPGQRAWMQFQNASYIVMMVIASWTALLPMAHPIYD